MRNALSLDSLIMDSLTVVEFSTTSFASETYVSEELNDNESYNVHGIALGADDVTLGSSGIKKLWPSDELQRAADTLTGKNLVVDHDNSVNGVVGRVTKAGYKEGSGIVYEAELFDAELAEKVKNGLLEVSIRGYHTDVDDLEEDAETGAKIVTNITFDNLSIVPNGASPSNTIEMGAHAELSAAELIAFTESLSTEELAVEEPGQWVKWGDNRGITVSMPDDGDIDVDVYEDVDGTWRSVGDIRTLSVNTLSEWDVDEDDIGSEADAEEAIHGGAFHAGQTFYNPMNDEMLEIVDVHTDTVTMRDEDGSTWDKRKSEVIDSIQDDEWLQMPRNIEVGDRFKSAINGGMVEVIDRGRGQVLIQAVDSPDSTWWDRIVDVAEKVEDGAWMPIDTMASMAYDEMAPVSDFVFTDKADAMQIVEDDEFDILTDVHSHMQDGEEVWMPGADMDEFNSWHEMKHSDDEMSSDIPPYAAFLDADDLGRSNVAQYDVEADQWVQWYPSETTEKHGYATSVSGDDVTIEVWTQLSDGTWKTDGDTVTKSMDEVEPWGNFPREQEDFAIDGADPRRAVRPSEEENALSEATETALRNKVESHNEEHGDEDGKRVTYRMLKSVYNRGGGAYDDSHREGMTRQQWSMARVNAFLYLVRNGNPENDAYVQDNDLLPDDHPRATEEENALVDAPDYYDGQMVYWQVNPSMMGRVVHVDEDRQIVMVEVMEEEDGEMQSSGFTVSAGYSDLMPMDEDRGSMQPRMMGDMGDLSETPIINLTTHEILAAFGEFFENAVTSTNVPTQDAQPQHIPMGASDMSRIMEQFIVEEGPDATVGDFIEWLDGEELVKRALEGEEEPITSKKLLESSHEGEPHRYIDAEDESVELQENELDEVYSDWSDAVNMTASELRRWSTHPCSREASLDPTAVIRRNLRLLETNKSDWDAKDIADAKRTISFVARMRGAEPDDPRDGPKGCTSPWSISLLNWAYNPFDDMPPIPEGMERVDEVTLSADDRTIMNDNETTSELQEYAMHDVEFTGTTERSWDAPDMEDFDTDDMSEIDNHFLISMSGFPPENYGDLKLPVVEPNGDLNINALAAAKGGRGVSRVTGLDAEMEEEIVEYINDLANEEFDRDWGMDEMAYNNDMTAMMEDYMYETRQEAMDAAEDMGLEGTHMHDGMYCPGETHQDLMDAVASMGMHGDMPMDDEEDEMGQHGHIGRPTASKRVGRGRSLPGDDLHSAVRLGASDADSLTQYPLNTMNDTIEEKLSELEEPVAVEAAELSALQEKADRFESMEESIESLRERTEILDEVDRSQVEQLAQAEDAIVVESARYDELEREAAAVKTVYAESLATEMPAFSAEELSTKFTIEELREKFEETLGSVEEELAATTPEPRSQDHSEEELSEETPEDTSEEELQDEIASIQADLRQKIVGGN